MKRTRRLRGAEFTRRAAGGRARCEASGLHEDPQAPRSAKAANDPLTEPRTRMAWVDACA